MKTLLATLTIPLILINAFGWIVFGIWLAVLGEWGAIASGVFSAIVGTMIIGLALFPHLAIGAAAAAALKRGRRTLGWFCLTAATAYLFLVATIWCFLVFGFYLRQVHQPTSLAPMLFWSYGVAVGPWAYLASKDAGSANEFEGMTMFFIQGTYLLMVLIVAIGRASTGAVMVSLGCLAIGMTAAFVTQLIWAALVARQLGEDVSRI